MLAIMSTEFFLELSYNTNSSEVSSIRYLARLTMSVSFATLNGSLRLIENNLLLEDLFHLGNGYLFGRLNFFIEGSNDLKY